MASAPTTKLQAINTILSSVGESPITSLDYISDSASATIASNIFDEVDRSFQSRGWSFNTDIGKTLTRGSNNEISVSSSTIRVNVSETTYPTLRVVLRGTKLYDARSASYIFSSNIVADVVTLLDFELVPEPARNFIVIRSSRLFNIRTRPEEALAKITELDEQLAFSTFLEFEVRTGIDLNFLKYSPELDALGINQAIFLSSSADDKLKLIQTSATNIAERQGRLYFQNRIEGKTTATSDTFATYIEGFRRLGITEKDFITLDAMQKEEALVIAKGATSSSTTDTRASKFFASGVADKARKLGIRYSEFCQLPNEAQQVFLDGVTSLTEDRFSRYVANKAKALKIGVRITDFLTIKPEEQELFLDTLASASYSDTRATDYVTNQVKLKSIGVYPQDFFALSPEQQTLLLETIATFTEDRITRFNTASIQTNLRKLGIDLVKFLSLPREQQNLILDGASGLDNIIASQATAITYFEAVNTYGKAVNNALRYLGIHPISSFTASDTGYTALKIITEIDILIQSEGWHFNTEKGIILSPDPSQDNHIYPGEYTSYEILGFDSDKYEDYKHNIVLRKGFLGWLLYDVTNQTDIFTTKVKGDLILKLDWQNIPPVFQRYIIIRTAKELAPILGKSEFMKNLLLEESRARMEAIQYDSENADYSMFDTYDVARVLDRSTGNSSIAY